MTLIAGLIIFWTCVALGAARGDDSGSVTGTVRRWESAATTVGAVDVSIKGLFAPSRLELRTDQSGRFVAVGLEPGRYAAIFTKVGMDMEISTFDVCPSAVTSMTVFMRDSPTACSLNCVQHPVQPKPMILSTSSTTVVFNQWSGMSPPRCL
jgi:hypothetical protein